MGGSTDVAHEMITPKLSERESHKLKQRSYSAAGAIRCVHFLMLHLVLTVFTKKKKKKTPLESDVILVLWLLLGLGHKLIVSRG